MKKFFFPTDLNLSRDIKAVNLSLIAIQIRLLANPQRKHARARWRLPQKQNPTFYAPLVNGADKSQNYRKSNGPNRQVNLCSHRAYLSSFRKRESPTKHEKKHNAQNKCAVTNHTLNPIPWHRSRWKSARVLAPSSTLMAFYMGFFFLQDVLRISFQSAKPPRSSCLVGNSERLLQG